MRIIPRSGRCDSLHCLSQRLAAGAEGAAPRQTDSEFAAYFRLGGTDFLCSNLAVLPENIELILLSYSYCTTGILRPAGRFEWTKQMHSINYLQILLYEGNCQVQITPIDSVANFCICDIIMKGWQIEVWMFGKERAGKGRFRNFQTNPLFGRCLPMM